MTRSWLGRFGALALALALGPACGAPAADLRIGLSADVTSIDPHWSNSGPNVAVSHHIFEPLTQTDPNGRLVPGLAESWRNVDPLTWEVRLRGGVKFSDGSEMTADDVLYSLDRPMRITGSPGSFAQFVRPITAMQIIDRHTLRLHTATPYVLLPYDLNSVFIVSKKAATGATQADFDSGKAAIGTGPYRLVSFARGENIVLERNPAYWGTPAVFDHVVLRLLTNDAARTAALLSGDVDAIENVPPQDLPRLEQDARFKLERRVSWRTIFWHMDQYRDATPDITDAAGKPLPRNPLKDVRVRRALSLAINRQGIADRIMGGLAIPTANLVSPGVFGHNDALAVDPYDPAQAKQLLAQAGYPNGFSLTLHAPNNRYVNDEKVAQAVAAMFSRIGVPTRVVTHPWAAYLPLAREGRFSVELVGWGSLLGDNTVKAHLATPNEDKGYGTWNFGRYTNPQLDAMLDEDLTIFDDAQREQRARALIAFAMRDTPVLPMYHQLITWVVRRGIAYPGRVDEFTLAQQFTRQ